MNFDEFFKQALGKQDDLEFGAFQYQKRLAEKPWPELLNIPTGMGKTAAVILAWSWKRGWRSMGRAADRNPETPRRLVYCLPMRVLVEQTENSIRQWLGNLGVLGNAGEGKVSVHVLMGGADDLKTWAKYPEEDMILIGTQDMLLSRALMRGYGMSRYQWPIHFALLHNDAMWVFDEVQLMGAGLVTSAQLEAFRRSFPLAKSSRSLWMSATLNRNWLGTVDLVPHLKTFVSRCIGDEDRRQAGGRLAAAKSLVRADASLMGDANNKNGRADYTRALCDAVLQAHETDAQTLVIINRVDRVQALFRALQDKRPDRHDLLIHARFRAAERAEQMRRLHDETSTDRIIVATQAIEAGVDLSSKVLITELAPWASMVQRFGRCNRYGEYNASGARVLWVNIADDADTLPYSIEELADARSRLIGMKSASPQDLPAIDNERPLTTVLRRKDLLDLFNTDPDLSGFDVDVSTYIRDSGLPGLQVFWRDFDIDPNQPEPQPRPGRAELCPVSIGQAKALAKRKNVDLWRWDTLDDQWIKLDRAPRPGMTVLVNATCGGYDKQIGFDPSRKKPPVPVIVLDKPAQQNAFDEDWRSQQPKPVTLPDHLGHVADCVRQLCAALEETTHAPPLIHAGRWHDLGKVHKVFQKSMYRCKETPGKPLAKSACPGPMRHSRRFFRHELASMLAWLGQHDGHSDADLIAYLIAAHHGKVRMSLRAMPTEQADPGIKRYARGVWEDDVLPALDFDGEHSNETTLKLALMELGEGEQGPSWTARTLKLLDQHGPFQLAWLETLVRLADWRASASEQDSP